MTCDTARGVLRYDSVWRVKGELLKQISEDAKLPEANFRRRIAVSGCAQRKFASGNFASSLICFSNSRFTLQTLS